MQGFCHSNGIRMANIYINDHVPAQICNQQEWQGSADVIPMAELITALDCAECQEQDGKLDGSQQWSCRCISRQIVHRLC